MRHRYTSAMSHLLSPKHALLVFLILLMIYAAVRALSRLGD